MGNWLNLIAGVSLEFYRNNFWVPSAALQRPAIDVVKYFHWRAYVSLSRLSLFTLW